MLVNTLQGHVIYSPEQCQSGMVIYSKTTHSLYLPIYFTRAKSIMEIMATINHLW